jgi:hypothetical protein
MNTKKLASERGQTLVFVVIGFLVFVAILALVIDGGNAYAAKRQAQNAADAGALAGATAMCKYKNATLGRDTAIEYATKNGAVDPPVVFASLDAGTVVVTATVERDTFFAGIIGFPEVTPRAVAEAACRPAVGMGVLPVAWSCRDTVIENGVIVPGVDCAQKLIKDCGGEPYGPEDIGCTYILMDSVKVSKGNKGGKCKDPLAEPTLPGGACNPDYCYCDPFETDPLACTYCKDINDRQKDIECSAHLDAPTCTSVEADTIDCDLNNDCIDELMTGGARSWLDLDGGGGGANELSDWIINGFPDPIPPHKWIPEESGVATSIFHTAAAAVVGEDVILPVFNKTCGHYPDTTTITETLDACTYYPAWDNRDIAGPSTNFHVITFAEFHVTCVQTTKNKVTAETGYQFDNPKKNCNGHDDAVATGSIDGNDKTIEGYFKEVNLGGYSGPGDWWDTGTFTVVLVR